MFKLGYYNDEVIWAHNYCIIVYMMNIDSSQCFHVNNKLEEKLKLRVCTKKELSNTCSICKNSNICESIYKVRYYII